MTRQANGTLDISADVQQQLGALLWDNLVLRAQVQELQQQLVLSSAESPPQPEAPESSPEYMTIPTNHQQQDAPQVA